MADDAPRNIEKGPLRSLARAYHNAGPLAALVAVGFFFFKVYDVDGEAQSRDSQLRGEIKDLRTESANARSAMRAHVDARGSQLGERMAALSGEVGQAKAIANGAHDLARDTLGARAVSLAQNKSFREALVGEIKKDESFSEELKAALSAVPIGTVVAWPGSSAPPGWEVCKGQEFGAKDATHGWDVEGLRIALGRPGANPYGPDRLPDYRGLFLRGMNHGRTDGGRDRDEGSRLEHRSWTKGATELVGSVQPFATARPASLRIKKDGGAHSHALPGGDITDKNEWVYNAIRVGLNPAMKKNIGGGSHSHEIEGGDLETRPVNVYVNWIIKVK